MIKDGEQENIGKKKKSKNSQGKDPKTSQEKQPGNGPQYPGRK